MKKIIPFKKDIIFKTNLKEITSISLENTLKVDDDLVCGDFIVSGDYKITETSVNTELFSYELPFEVAFDSKYDLKNAIIDIDDFYYEIINDSVLSINIDVAIDKIEENELEEEEIEMNNIENEIEEIESEDERCVEEENVEVEDESQEQISLFDNINIDDTYNTYKVYIVRENDTLESICDKYSVSKDNLELYNNLSEIKLGDKIIIPIIYEGN